MSKASTTIGFDLITSLHSSEMIPKFKTVLNHDRLETSEPKSNQSSQLPFAGDGGVRLLAVIDPDREKE